VRHRDHLILCHHQRARHRRIDGRAGRVRPWDHRHGAAT